jgi:hypothetical protein
MRTVFTPAEQFLLSFFTGRILYEETPRLLRGASYFPDDRDFIDEYVNRTPRYGNVE